MTTLLPVSFLILQSVGLWEPVHWTPGWKTHLYKVFTFFSVTILYNDTISAAVDAFKVCKTVSDYADHSFILLTMIGICIKMASVLKNRGRIINLMRTLQSGSFKTKNQVEDHVRMNFETAMKWRTISFCFCVQFAVAILIVRSLMYLAPYRMNITKLYLPWDNKTFIGYWTSWVIQAYTRWFCGLVNVACDSLVSGIMYRAAVQYEILKLRLNEIKNPDQVNETKGLEQYEAKKISELVEQHLEIIEIISKLNDIFGFVIFVQYCVSSTVLCVTVFVFAQVEHFDEYAAMMLVYTGCLYFQIYLLCSAGSEMTSESGKLSTYIFTSNWEELQISTKKSLLLMMLRSYRPLKFTSFNIIELSIDSFSQIVKFSYSAYNVLAQRK